MREAAEIDEAAVVRDATMTRLRDEADERRREAERLTKVRDEECRLVRRRFDEQIAPLLAQANERAWRLAALACPYRVGQRIFLLDFTRSQHELVRKIQRVTVLRISPHRTPPYYQLALAPDRADGSPGTREIPNWRMPIRNEWIAATREELLHVPEPSRINL